MPRPRHDDSAEAIRELVADDDRPPGERMREALARFIEGARPGLLLPSERVLAERMNVARMTVRGVIKDLEREGLLRRVPGRGTFVQERRLVYTDIFRSFSEDMRLRGMEPGDRAMTIRRRRAGQELAERLGIARDAPVIYVERVRTADGSPMALERTNLPAERFPGIEGMLHEGVSLYEVIARVYKVRLNSAVQRISIVRLNASEAAKLDDEESAPAFLIERRSMDNMGGIAEFGRSLYRGDRYAIDMHVTRPTGEPYEATPAAPTEPGGAG